MMIFAGHLPTKHFELAEWQKMHVYRPKFDGSFPDVLLGGTGFYRSLTQNGKPIVLFWSEQNFRTEYMVRPIVRVPMQKAA